MVSKIKGVLGIKEFENGEEYIQIMVEEYKKVEQRITSYEINEEVVIRVMKGCFEETGYSEETMIDLAEDVCVDLRKLGLGNIEQPLMNDVKNINKSANSFRENLKVDGKVIEPVKTQEVHNQRDVESR